MKDTCLRKEILNTIFKYANKDNCLVFLFGSFAKGKEKIYPGSDIDIGIISSRPLENLTLVRIKEALHEVKTLRDIDVVDFTPIQDKNFLSIALRRVEIWHQTKKSRLYLGNLKKHIKD